MGVGRAGLEPTTLCTSTIKKPLENIEELLERFREFELVDLRRDVKTTYEHVYYVRKFLKQLTKRVDMVSVADIREYLKSLNGVGSATYKNTLGALKVFFRDFLGMPQAVQSFKFPRQPFKPKRIFSREDLQRFYECLESPKEKALFLLYATSGLRRNEVLSLKPGDIDFKAHMITPNSHEGKTKQSWLSFYNEEAEKVLNEYLASKKPTRSERVFPMPREEEKCLWKTAKDKTGLNITPQRLREWFCCEMAMLGVSDRYIDAFCGRTPKTILARNYTDYSPEKLKLIYEKANLKVFD
jgi:integrase/recombinase XerD